jgi:hypothetical protein
VAQGLKIRHSSLVAKAVTTLVVLTASYDGFFNPRTPRCWHFYIAIYKIISQDEEVRLTRRCITRYACLAIVITYRNVSSKVFKRFPTLQHLVDAGLMSKNELEMLTEATSRSEFLAFNHWIPLSWASSLVDNAYEKVFFITAI